MKKVLLFLSLALFLTAAVVTVTKIQNVTAAPAEISLMVDDNAEVQSPLTEEDEKEKKAKDGKCVKEKCDKENCDEAKCAEKKAKGKCCDKTKSCNKGKGGK